VTDDKRKTSGIYDAPSPRRSTDRPRNKLPWTGSRSACPRPVFYHDRLRRSTEEHMQRIMLRTVVFGLFAFRRCVRRTMNGQRAEQIRSLWAERGDASGRQGRLLSRQTSTPVSERIEHSSTSLAAGVQVPSPVGRARRRIYELGLPCVPGKATTTSRAASSDDGHPPTPSG